jgi:hypothetical protein
MNYAIAIKDAHKKNRFLRQQAARARFMRILMDVIPNLMSSKKAGSIPVCKLGDG